MLPEAMDLAEIDKLTGMPKAKGNQFPVNIFRLTVVRNSDVSAVYNY